MGRPSEYSEDLAGQICERLAEGESLRAICLDEAMPGQTTVFRWLDDSEAFRKQYARARELQAETYADEIVEIADRTFIERKVVETGELEIVPLDHNRARLQMDARKWAASKLAPKKYGDKLGVEHGGEVGLTVNIKRYGPSGD